VAGIVKLTTHFQLVSRLRVIALYFHSPIHFHGVVVNETQGQICLLLFINNLIRFELISGRGLNYRNGVVKGGLMFS
jgi:hypothetical protein